METTATTNTSRRLIAVHNDGTGTEPIGIATDEQCAESDRTEEGYIEVDGQLCYVEA